MDIAFFVLAGLLLLEKLWRHVLVMRFFGRKQPSPDGEVASISILQPILSGDPTLASCLEHNLNVNSRYDLEFLWLVDETDRAARVLCERLKGKYPRSDVKVVVLPPPADGCSPKMFKLVEAVPRARGEFLCVLDDDTMLPPGGLELCVARLREPNAGLAFGLPYYVSFGSFWSRWVAYFVNSHSLLTYVPYTALVEPFTTNGMFYVFARGVYEATGGFGPLQGTLADDFAVARHFRGHGYRLLQTTVRHAISTHVAGSHAYFRLLHRWLIFPRETLLKAMPLRDRLVFYFVGLFSTLGPLLLLAGLLVVPGWLPLALVLGLILYHYLIFAHFNIAYLHRASPWRHSWMVPVIYLFLPLQVLAAVLMPQRINWRGHLMDIKPGGGFRFVRRRAEDPGT